MNLLELRAAFLARGFDYLTETEANDYLNDAYLLDILEGEDWPFLETSKTAAPPFEISDLKHIEYVTFAARVGKLDPMLPARITDDWSTDLTQTGTPELYYLTEGKKVNVFPVSTEEITVRYWKVATALAGTTEPVMPERWHSLIIDGAVARAYEKTADWELSQAATSRFEARLQTMRESLLDLQHDSSDDYVVLEDEGRLR